jgi:hypothetical protein
MNSQQENDEEIARIIRHQKEDTAAPLVLWGTLGMYLISCVLRFFFGSKE